MAKRKRKVDFRKVVQAFLDDNDLQWCWLAQKCQMSGQKLENRTGESSRYETQDIPYRLVDGEVKTKTRRVATTSRERPIGMTEGSMYRFLRGERDVSSERIAEILHVIGMEVVDAGK